MYKNGENFIIDSRKTGKVDVVNCNTKKEKKKKRKWKMIMIIYGIIKVVMVERKTRMERKRKIYA